MPLLNRDPCAQPLVSSLNCPRRVATDHLTYPIVIHSTFRQFLLRCPQFIPHDSWLSLDACGIE